MKQPELGKKILEIRNKNGITQKELSDECRIDIRTIQRIEAGEVEPRMSTLRLIAETLHVDPVIFNGNNALLVSKGYKNMLLFSFVMGLINFFNFLVYAPLFPGLTDSLPYAFRIGFSIVNVFTGVIFYFGVLLVVKKSRNYLLLFSLVMVIILIPLFVIILFFMPEHAMHIGQVMAINGILLGVGLMIHGYRNSLLYTVIGILQLITNPMFLIPNGIVQLIGLWLSLPFILLLLVAIYYEYQKVQE